MHVLVVGLVNEQGRHLQEVGRNDRGEDRGVEVVPERVQASIQVSKARMADK